METRMISVITDDNGNEVREGDIVLVRGTFTPDEIQAEVRKIMPNTVVLVTDDRVLGYRPMRIRTRDINGMTLFVPKVRK